MKIIILVALSFLAAAGFSQVTVKDSTLQYEIQLPSKWHVSNVDIGELTMTSPAENILDAFIESINVSVIPKGISLEEHNEQHIKSAYKDDIGFRGFRLIGYKLTTINGKRATINQERFHDGSRMLDIFLVTIEGKYFFYQIVCASISGRFPEHKSNFERVINTFKIDESKFDQATVNTVAKRLGIPLNDIPKVPERPDN